MHTTAELISGISTIPELRLLGNPELSVVRVLNDASWRLSPFFLASLPL
jgi:hypothetical protein